ncbi:hypothetical protein, partial [Mesorhizobium sp. M0060]|uniref:hypothetical protein n=1 Tax=Mesorhizobium sp. M0060 TaxID=2956866 RepID=UPI0033389AE3
MIAPAGCQLIGRWRIIEADLWDRGYLDLGGPATITIGADNHGEIAFGALQAGLDLGYSPSMVFFTWAGCDEMDEVTGDGSAELLDDGSIEITFAYHNGDHPQGNTADFFNRWGDWGLARAKVRAAAPVWMLERGRLGAPQT